MKVMHWKKKNTVSEALKQAGQDLKSGKFDPRPPVTKEGWFTEHPTTGKMVEVVTAEWALSNADDKANMLMKKNERITVDCPQCHKPFALRFARDFDVEKEPPTLIIRDCPSGGIYDVHIECPHCNYEEPL